MITFKIVSVLFIQGIFHMGYCAPTNLGIGMGTYHRIEHATEGTMTITYLGKCENLRHI